MKNKKTILIAVTGSIAAYKAADLVSRFIKEDWNVHVVMSASAQKFITPFTLQTLSQNEVIIDTFDERDPKAIYHVDIVKHVDVILLAPASAHTIGKIAIGLADNMLTNILLVGHNKLRIYAPAMNTNMYLNPIVQKNMKILEDTAWKKIRPKHARLACGDEGIGALADIDVIVSSVLESVSTHGFID